MTDVIALLAISQLTTLGALFYLHLQVQQLRRDTRPVRRTQPPATPVPGIPVRGAALRRTASTASASTPRPPRGPSPASPTPDVAELARRMHRSEEEIRLLLRRKGIAS